MRVAPVGLVFRRDPIAILEQARRSALPTHRHPIGIDAAQVLAAGVAYLVQLRGDFERGPFLQALRAIARTDEVSYALRIASKLTPDDSLGTLGHGLEAHRSVPTAIACFAMNPGSYLDTISAAISLGGDTDTLAAMAGALSGAWLGASAIPRHLVDRLENGAKGRDYLASLAMSLMQCPGE
jgi:poly(ADP-ribose) glycohydrolase ARH3